MGISILESNRRRMMKIAILVCLASLVAAEASASAEADADAYYQPYNQFSYNQGYNNWNQGYNNYNQGYNNKNNRFNSQRNINNMNFHHTMQKLNGFNNMFSSNCGKRSADAEADADAYYQPYDQFSYNQGYNNWNQGYNNYNQGYNNFNQGYNNYNNMGSNRFNSQK